jgi:hypothetical protein
VVTGNKDLSPLIWWTNADHSATDSPASICLTLDGDRPTFLLYSGSTPVLLGAIGNSLWPEFFRKIAPLVGEDLVYAFPSRWSTLLPDALHTLGRSEALIHSLGGDPKSVREYHCLKQNVHVVYQPDIPSEIQNGLPRVAASRTIPFPSEALDWEFPSLASGRHVVVHLFPSSLQISAFDQTGKLVFSNRFDAQNANDALYALGLVYEHTGWSGLEAPLFWHGSRPDWDTIQQGMSAFVLDIKPLSPPKALPEALGDWRSHPSLQSLFRLWLCAS